MKICLKCKSHNEDDVFKCRYCGYTKFEDANAGPDPGKPLSLPEAIAYAKKATVKICSSWEDDDNTYISTGTGFFMTYKDHNFLVTNAHVLKDCVVNRGSASYAPSPEINRYKNKYPIELLAVDELNDIAICEANYLRPQELNFLPLIDNTEELELGDEVFTIGNPRFLEFCPEKGIISNFEFSEGVEMNKILVNMLIDHGNSGGPVIRLSDLKLVGIASGSFVAKVDTKKLNNNTVTIVSAILSALGDEQKLGEVLDTICGDSFNEKAWKWVTVDPILPGKAICASGEAIAMLINKYLKKISK